MGTYSYTHQCQCPDATVLFTVTGADAQAWKDHAALGGHCSECPVCGCCWRTEDDGADVGSGGGVQAKDESKPEISALPLAVSGPVAGGTVVRITGHALDHVVPTVLFNGVAGTSPSVIDRTGMDITTPAGTIELVLADGPYSKLEHGTVAGGPFQVSEEITGGASGATADIVRVEASHLLVTNVSGDFQNGETLNGGTSMATADLSSDLIAMPFQIGETVTGETSTETGIVDQVIPLRISTPSGTFTASEDVTGGTSGARATLDGTTPMNGNVDVEISNSWGSRSVGNKLVGAFEYTV